MIIFISETLTSKYGHEMFHRFDIDINDAISKLLNDFSVKTNIPSINFNLYKDDSILDNEQYFGIYNFHENDVVTIGLSGVNNLDDNYMKICVDYYLDEIKCLKLFVKSNDTVGLLKENLNNQLPLTMIDGSKSIFSGNIVMKDNKTLYQYGVRDYSRITLKQNILLKNISNRVDFDWNFNGVIRITFQSNESIENFRHLSESIKIAKEFINVIDKKEIVNELAAGNYLCFVCDETYTEDSIVVFVKESFTISGESTTHSLVVRGSYRVSETTNKIQDTLNITNTFKCKCGPDELNDSLDLTANKVSDFSELILLFQILIKDMLHLTNYTVWISLDYSVLQLKEIIGVKLATSAEFVNLTFQGNQFENNDLLLGHYEIDEGATIMMIATVYGGE